MSTFCVTDLTLDELREWIADWCFVEFWTDEIGDPPIAWYELRYELLEAYADRLRESVQP